ncbi:MAG: hypothetical protein JWO08_1994 [Verrucomicrobiaceae bacterium]|nr:hypothetical protein [Verrucomicrobiaceae bacterium]
MTPNPTAPPDSDYPEPDDLLMYFLAGVYGEHGAETERKGNWISVDQGKLFTRVAYPSQRQHPAGLVLQVDFVTVTADGRHIVESFAGIGADLSAALQDACGSFLDSCFHVFVVALLGRHCDHADRQQWRVGGRERRVTLGGLRIRGELPTGWWPPVLDGIRHHLEALPLAEGQHWIRYFYCHAPSNPPTIEILIDNEPHEELQTVTANLPWPQKEGFYSVRLFFVVD